LSVRAPESSSTCRSEGTPRRIPVGNRRLKAQMARWPGRRQTHCREQDTSAGCAFHAFLGRTAWAETPRRKS
jgi:hypothetical protein